MPGPTIVLRSLALWTVWLSTEKNRVALHDQVAAEIRRAIADGEVGPGERLPPARDLAAVLDVNTNTVYAPFAYFARKVSWSSAADSGITVTGSAPTRSPVISMTRELLRVARRHGVRRDELVRIIESLP